MPLKILLQELYFLIMFKHWLITSESSFFTNLFNLSLLPLYLYCFQSINLVMAQSEEYLDKLTASIPIQCYIFHGGILGKNLKGSV